jgi:hypothetical protein
MPNTEIARVGEIRPSQLLYTYGIGAIIDLPRISVIVTGLEDWPLDPTYVHPIVEDRLLQAVRYTHPDVQRLLSPPIVPESGAPFDPFDSEAKMGVPVAAFPRWMLCPECRLLAPLKSGLFDLKPDLYHPDRTAYRHASCNKTPGKAAPEVVPARFLVACENGHLDDFPWVWFVHRGESCDSPLLRLIERGPTGEARDVELRCESCGKRRRMAEAFGAENRKNMPDCRGRRPHLRDFDPDGCAVKSDGEKTKMRPIVLGASNTWFPVVQSTIAIPVESGVLAQLVADNWAVLQEATSLDVLKAFRSIGQLGGELSKYSDHEIWQAIQTKRQQEAGEIAPPDEMPDLKGPEWEVLVQHDPALNSAEFRLRPVPVPAGFSKQIQQIVLVERLREVRAIVGFTRIDSLGEFTDPDLTTEIDIAPISRHSPTWMPADDIRGEGIFIQFKEDMIQKWERGNSVLQRANEFFQSHKRWRESHLFKDIEAGFPGARYVLLHTFSHALMRQLSLECGYSAASIHERLYSQAPSDSKTAMAGILIFTAAPDSEGTLGGLVSMGETETLGRHITQALETAHLCASDPLCAAHPPSRSGQTIHAAACHACLFAPETACERGNKYLDRSTIVKTVERDDLAFFE